MEKARSCELFLASLLRSWVSRSKTPVRFHPHPRFGRVGELLLDDAAQESHVVDPEEVGLVLLEVASEPGPQVRKIRHRSPRLLVPGEAQSQVPEGAVERGEVFGHE